MGFTGWKTHIEEGDHVLVHVVKCIFIYIIKMRTKGFLFVFYIKNELIV